jgi:hypothetical protein
MLFVCFLCSDPNLSLWLYRNFKIQGIVPAILSAELLSYIMWNIKADLQKWQTQKVSRYYALADVIGSGGQNHLDNYRFIIGWIRAKFNVLNMVHSAMVRQFQELKLIFTSVNIL